ncbi:MAG: AbgT family transporter [Planctomycetia bacterium]|nr:AbgT family transporter [Planctomycetia bacterium]
MADEPVPPAPTEGSPPAPRGKLDRLLDRVEWLGNKLPDPVLLFLGALVLTWFASAWLASVNFAEIDPRTLGPGKTPAPIQVKNQLEPTALVTFLSRMVKTFVEFAPLGMVLVVLLGVGVAEHTGFINAGLKALLNVTPYSLLTPMVMLVAILSHAAGDSGYVVVIPLGGVIFHAAGRHPLAGIAVAFAGVSGGLSANFIPIMLDPLLQGITQTAAQIIDPKVEVNPLCNWGFTAASSLLVVLLGWFITERVVEPRLRQSPVDGDAADAPRLDPLTAAESRGLTAGLLTVAAMLLGLGVTALREGSPWRTPDGALLVARAPLIQSIVPLMFLLFLIPGIVYGYVAGTVKSHRDVIQGMSKAMGTMSYYLVLAFVAAQFIFAFGESNVGILIAVKGGEFLKAMEVSPAFTVCGIVLITAAFNLLIGSASAKWALLGPIFVPMLMQLGVSPELTQAAYRIGDSCTNIVTPLMPYFPLVVVFCQRYVKSTGIGTVTALMLPYSLGFLVCWTSLLLVYWGLGLPLGIAAPYTYPP